MKIQVLQQNRPVELTIISTQKGRTALTTDEPTPRERQLLLLLDKDSSDLSRQGVSLLLAKLDLNKLTKKGWVEYFVFDSPDVGMQIDEEVSEATEQNTYQPKSKNIRNFLDEYSQETDTSTEKVSNQPRRLTNYPKLSSTLVDESAEVMYVTKDKVSINPAVAPIMMSDIIDEDYESLSQPVANDEFDDIMILQSLLNAD